MATRGLFGGQAPEYKLEADPGAGQDGYFLTFDAATNAAAFTGVPYVPVPTTTLAPSSGASVTFTEDGGVGEIPATFGQCYRQELPGGGYLLSVTVVGNITSVNMTGGTTELKCTLPADLTSDNALTQGVGVAYVTDSSGPHICIVRVGDGANTMSLTRVSAGTFLMGACSFQSFHVAYVHP